MIIDRYIYRGKQIEDGEWVYGSLVLTDQDNEYNCRIQPYHFVSYAPPVDPATVEPVAAKVIELDKFTIGCPNCKKMVGDTDSYIYENFPKYCENCGQRLDWGEFLKGGVEE